MGSIQNFLFIKLCSIPGIILAITVQGFARAKMADVLGDKLPRFQGRLTLNPSAHIDKMGILLLILCGFGWSKPIETNPSSYKNQKNGELKVAIAPLIGNLLTAFVFAFIYIGAMFFIIPILSGSMQAVAMSMLSGIVQINLSIMIFNLIPLPGLCGWSIFKAVNPKAFFKSANTIYQNQTFILLAVILIGGSIISIPVGWLSNLFISIAKMFFRLFI